MGTGRGEELFCGWKQPSHLQSQDETSWSKGWLPGQGDWDARLEFWASRTVFHNLSVGHCWYGSGCDPWAGTSGLQWGGFGLERHPWGSPHSYNLAWKGVPGALPMPGIWCSQCTDLWISLQPLPGLSRAARLIPNAALLRCLSPLSRPGFIHSGNEAEHPLGKAGNSLGFPRWNRGWLEHWEQEIDAWGDNRRCLGGGTGAAVGSIRAWVRLEPAAGPELRSRQGGKAGEQQRLGQARCGAVPWEDKKSSPSPFELHSKPSRTKFRSCDPQQSQTN